jgi:hypothetical protein
MNAQQWGFPETIRSQAAQLSSKTRRLPDGRFEAAAAIFFMGQRGMTVYAVASSRYRAEKEVTRATETQSNYSAALAAGRISLQAFDSSNATGAAQ